MPNSTPIMNVNQLQLSLKALMRKLVDTSVAVPVTILTKLIRFQVKVWTFPVLFVVGGVKHVWEQTTEAEPPMASCEEVVNGVEKLRNSVLMGISSLHANVDPRSFKFRGTVDECPLEKDCITCLIDEKRKRTYCKTVCKDGSVRDGCSSQNQPENSKNEDNGNKPVKVVEMKMSEFFGDDLMWDVPILAKDANYLADCLGEKDPVETTTSRRELEDLSLVFPDATCRRRYEELVAMCNSLGCSELKSRTAEVTSNATNKSKSKKKVAFVENGRVKQRRNSKEIQSSIQRTCVSLLQIVSGLTLKIDEFINVAAELKHELDKEKKLLSEVEAERNVMKLKLSTLEELIKEEQEFLDDVSGESGFDETEHGPEDV